MIKHVPSSQILRFFVFFGDFLLLTDGQLGWEVGRLHKLLLCCWLGESRLSACWGSKAAVAVERKAQATC